MNKKLLVLIGLCFVLTASLTFAQEKKFELNGLIGYTLSEGVDINPIDDNGDIIDRISPKSGFSYGLGLDYFVREGFSVGFNFGQERSKLRARIQGLEGVDYTNMSVNNYHALFTYNFGDEDEPLRPFIFGGFGATHYSPGTIKGNAIEGASRFSTTWGGGVKYFTNESVGFKGGVRWTPSYIKSDPAGIWCSPYWPWSCWVVENANYSHQFELNVGVIVRF